MPDDDDEQDKLCALFFAIRTHFGMRKNGHLYKKFKLTTECPTVLDFLLEVANNLYKIRSKLGAQKCSGKECLICGT